MTVDLADRIPGDLYRRPDYGAPEHPGGAHRDLSAVDRAIFHWTTGRRLGRSTQPRWVKAIYDFHTGDRGWADIGYQFLVSRYGDVFEGRDNLDAVLRHVGAHAAGHNTESAGIALLGGTSEALTREAKIAVDALVDWLIEQGARFDVESGHRDVGSTSCPGDAFYQWVTAGRPAPDGREGDPDDGQPDDAGKPDWVVAVVADNPVDEGMARVLGRHYRWKFVHADDLDTVRIGTAVRVGAARGIDNGPWQATHDIGGDGRHETALAVADRIRADEGDSRSVE